MTQSEVKQARAQGVIPVICPSCNTQYRLQQAAIQNYPAFAKCKQCGNRIRIEAPAKASPPLPVQAAPQPAGPSATRPPEAAQPALAIAPDPPTKAPETDPVATFIGQNDGHYLDKFKHFSHLNQPRFAATWHWPAFFFPPLWFLYRKLYGWALVSFLCGLVPLIGLAARILWGITANYLYFKHVRRKIQYLKTRHHQQRPSDLMLALRRKGGVHHWVWAAAALPVVGIVAAVAIPQFAAYRNRAYDANARTAVQEIVTAQNAFFSANGAYANSVEQLQTYLPGPIASSLQVTLLDGDDEHYLVEGFHPRGRHRYTAGSDDQTVAELPISSQDLYDANRWCKITVPGDWKIMEELNAEASIQAGNMGKDAYAIVLSEDKSDFFAVDLASVAELASTAIEGALLSPERKTTDVVRVGGRKAVQYQISGALPDTRVRIVYLHTIVQGHRAFYQILTWTSEDNFAANRHLLNSISQRFSEL